MPKLTQTLGFWFSDKVTENDICYNNRKRITNLLLEQLPTNKNINIRLDPRVDYFLPMHWNNFTIKPRISYMLNDLGNLDVIYNKLPKMVKQNIRRAKKSNDNYNR